MNEKQAVKTSKFLSLVLRHKPDTIGIKLDEAGWVLVEDLLAGCVRVGMELSRDQLDYIVANNSKKRFEFNSDNTMIRACQGHSVTVNLGYSVAEPPKVLYHGTAIQNIAAIRVHGLTKRNRHHVHLSKDPETAKAVGSRHGKPVVIEVNSEEMAAEGFAFFISANGVWLTEHVPASFLVLPEDYDG